MSDIPILIAGDPHGHWRPVHAACWQTERPGVLILLGDCDLQVPLSLEFSTEIAEGWCLHWITGNHDSDNFEYYDNLYSLPDGDIGSRSITVNNLNIAGLGGTYRGKIWYPRLPDAPAVFRTRKEYLRQVRHYQRWRGGLPLPLRSAIFPEDHTALVASRLDVLVSHEAPATKRMSGKGFHGLTELLDVTATRICVHGHHHTSYSETLVLPSGRTCVVRGLAIGEVWRLEMPL